MKTWNDISFPAHEDRLWELYHENSKVSRYRNLTVDTEAFQKEIDNLHVALPVQSGWKKQWDNAPPGYMDVFSGGISPVHKGPGTQLTLETLGAMLQRSNLIVSADGSPSFALLPLEVFGVTIEVEDMPTGVFHCNMGQRQIQFIQERMEKESLKECFPDAGAARAYIFITAMFLRTVMVFDERGYRFALTESGRLMQSILLAAKSLNLSAQCITQYYERNIEKLIGIDGVEHALLQVIALEV